MRKILLTAACLFVASNASAVSLKNITMQFFDAAGEYQAPNYTATGYINTTAVTGHILGAPAFFGKIWTADVVWSSATAGANTWSGTVVIDTSAGTPTNFNYTFTLAAGDVAVGLYFDWSSSTDIPVLAVFRPDGGGSWTPVDQVWYRGTATTPKTGMQAGPFPGQFPKFSGVTDDPPVITILPDNPTFLTVGDPAYVDAGATATDTEDGDLTDMIEVGGDTVDTNVIGTYHVTYDVIDSTEQPATQAVRTVNVNAVCAGTEDVLPEITVNPDPLTLAMDATYDQTSGVMITDNCCLAMLVDGVTNGCGTITWGGNTVDTSVPGASYTITIHACDEADTPNCTDATRVVNIEDLDIVLPVITLIGANSIEVTQGDTWTDPGYTATDNRDGVITSDVVISGQTVDTSVVGNYTIYYNVSDAAGNAAPFQSRTVTVVAPECVTRGASANNFTMYENSGAVTGAGSNTVWFYKADGETEWEGLEELQASMYSVDDLNPTTHLWDVPANATLGSSCLFMGDPWFANPVWIFGPGTYTFDACPAGSEAGGTDGSNNCTPGNPAHIITMTVPEGKIGAHMLFSWGPSTHIDMIQLWELHAVYGGLMAQGCGGANANKVWDLASTDINGDGIMGAPFVDGPFGGFSGNLNIMVAGGGKSLAYPTLEIQGSNPLPLAMDDTFTCPSAMADDVTDGALCSQVTVRGCDDVDTSTPGAYTVKYQVVDSDGNKVSNDLLAIVFGPAEDVPTGNMAGANPLVTFGDDADYPVIIMSSALNVFGKPRTLLNGDTSVNLEPCVGRDCESNFGDNLCADPGAMAMDLQDGALSGANFTTTFEKLVAGGWVEVEALDCSKPAQYRLVYTAADNGTDNGLEPGMVQGAAITTVYTTEAVRYFNVNAIPTADEQLPAEQSDNADVGGGCSAGNGQNNPLQRADLLLLGGFLAALGLRRVKRSDV